MRKQVIVQEGRIKLNFKKETELNHKQTQGQYKTHNPESLETGWYFNVGSFCTFLGVDFHCTFKIKLYSECRFLLNLLTKGN